MSVTRGLVQDSSSLDLRVLPRSVLFPVTIAFLVLSVVLAADPPLPVWMVVGPFAVSVLVFGLPHGALDHLVPARLAGRRPTVSSVAVIALVYVVIAAAVLVAWSVAPAAAFLGFIALTWFHWGQGDLWVALAGDSPGRLRPRILRAGTIVVRGGLPMLVPLLFHSATYELVRRGTMEVFGTGADALTFLALGHNGRTVLGGIFAAILLAMAAVTWRAALSPLERRAWLDDQIEIVALALFFAVGPPILTVGLYFCFWHSLRHIVRLEMLDARGSGHLRRGEYLGAARRFAKDAAPITAIAVLFLAAMYMVLPPPSDAPAAMLAPYLVMISALTVPHVVVVSYMDKRQGVWSRS